MTKEEDDYMGDLTQFLPAETSNLPSTSNKVEIRPTSKSSHKHPRKLKRERESAQEEEDKKTLENIQSSVIPDSNIGFKLLKQMGYQPGRALGKDGSGRAEPVGVEIRRTRAGIGREDPRKRREMELMERDKRWHDEMVTQFGCRQKEQWREKRIFVNFRKAKAVLELLEGEKDSEAEEEVEEQVITEEDMFNILTRLREEYQYCLFCGYRYESTEALLSNCPGLNEDDH